MMNPLRFLALALLVCALNGCDKPPEPPAQVVGDPTEPTHAQSTLPTMRIYVATQELVAELALSYEQQRIGMMFRTNLSENAGMIFPLAVTQRASFWM
jgi:uncharacterized protein